MALPTTIVSKAFIPGHKPPFKSAAGAFYVIALASADSGPGVYKATDPADAWVEQDTANNPSVSITTSVFSVVQEGDLLHMAYGVTTLTYSQFDMSSDTWQNVPTGKTQTIDSLTNAPTFPWVSIAVRSDGDVVVVYAGDTDQVMGGKKERVDVNVRTSGTWGGAVVLSANDTADEHYGNPNCVKASDSDDIHIVWGKTTALADPPTAWSASETRTIDSGDTLSTIDLDAIDTAGVLLGIQNGVSFDDSGTQVARFAAVTPTFGPCFLLSHTGTGGKEIEFEATSNIAYAGATFSPKVNGEAGIATIAGPDADGDLHILWSNTDDTDDIYYVTSTDTGDTWSAEAQEGADAVTCNFISANIYVRGIDTVLAYIYDDGGVTKYNEKVIIEGVAGDPQPMIIRGTNVPHVRQWHPRGLRR